MSLMNNTEKLFFINIIARQIEKKLFDKASVDLGNVIDGVRKIIDFSEYPDPMIAGRWNYQKCEYESYELPLRSMAYSEDMEEIIQCAQCGKYIKYGESYTSLEIHTDIGIGYMVCDECSRQEYKRKLEANDE